MTDLDKELAAELAHALGLTAEEFTSGACDVLLQIAARHRETARAWCAAATAIEQEATQ